MVIDLIAEINMKESVNRGAELLDRVMPDWRSKINVDTLNMGSPADCILGQLYGLYHEGLYKLGLTEGEDRFLNGFSYGGPETWHNYQSNSNEWTRLRELWIEKIND